jgi:hypothetical protein
MAKPRVFVISTYYDLKHIRNSLEAFIESLGYDPVLFESGILHSTMTNRLMSHATRKFKIAICWF